MLLGTYTLRLTEKCEVILPEKIISGLCAGGGRKEVWFVPAFHLRCYSYEGALKLRAVMSSLNDEQTREWVRYTTMEGMARVAYGGMVRIPDTFCRHYGFVPSQEISLLGFVEYVELRHTAP